mgnify:CR=1 FL=1
MSNWYNVTSGRARTPPTPPLDDSRIARRVWPGQSVTFAFRADLAGSFPLYANPQVEDGCRQVRGVLVGRPRQ